MKPTSTTIALHNPDAAPELIEKKTLTDEERKELAEHEQIIDKAIKHYETAILTAGRSLSIIKENKWYWEKYPGDFEGYIRARFKKSIRTGEVWMWYYENTQLLEREGLPAPKSLKESMRYAPLQKEPGRLVKFVRWLKGQSRKFKATEIEQLAKAAAEDEDFQKRNAVALLGEAPAAPPTNGHRHQASAKRAYRKANKKAQDAADRGAKGFPKSADKNDPNKVLYRITEKRTIERQFFVAFPKDVPLLQDKIVKELAEAIEEEHKGDFAPVGEMEFTKAKVKPAEVGNGAHVADAVSLFPKLKGKKS